MRRKATLLLVVGLVLGAVAVDGPEARAKRTSTSLERLEVATDNDGTTYLRLACRGKPDFAFFRLEQPPRIVVDVSNASATRLPKWRDIGSWAVSSVSTSRVVRDSWAGVRITVGLRRKVATRVHLEEGRLVIRVQALEPPPSREAGARGHRPGRLAAQANTDASKARQQAVDAERRARAA